MKKEGNTTKKQAKKTAIIKGIKGSKATTAKGDKAAETSSKVVPWLAKATRGGAYNLKRLLKPEKYSKDFMNWAKKKRTDEQTPKRQSRLGSP
ncbi:hypothetical protein E4V51_21260 [Paenibacillus sp. 28ISP30-2]|nr:hypothetical protein [Paenibacillus sp. 28ISP30-2]